MNIFTKFLKEEDGMGVVEIILIIVVLVSLVLIFKDKIIWEKTNPSPMNGQYIYLSGVEIGVWYKKQGAKTFNAHCKNTVFHYPNGRSKLHPTEKNHALLEDLIKDNTNEGQTVFDPCCGSGSHCLVAKNLGRKYIGVELDEQYFDVAKGRLANA